MKLLQIKIAGFGCHRDRQWEFGPGLNLFVGPNEAGKTTLLRCVLGMLYPLTRRRGATTPELDLCAPWQGGPYAAALTLETDSGRRLEIRKTFARDKERVAVVDAQRGDVTGEFLEGPDGRDRDVGASLFNLAREEFQHSAYIRYGEMSWSAYKNGRGQLAQRLEQMVDAQSGSGAAAALEVLKSASNRLYTERSRERELDVLTRQLAQLRVRIADLDIKYDEIAARQAERERLERELGELDAGVAREEFLELAETERELAARIERARALEAEIAQLAARVLELGELPADPTRANEELVRCRAVRMELEKDLADRQEQFHREIVERGAACRERVSARFQKILAVAPAELERMEEQARRWLDCRRRLEEIEKSLSEEEQRLAGEGIHQRELADINLRFMRHPDKMELIETGKERLSELENSLIVKNQELRELENGQLHAQSAASRWGIGSLVAFLGAVLCFALAPAQAAILGAAALAICAILLLTVFALRYTGIGARFKRPLGELEAALAGLRGERETLFRQLESSAQEMQFAGYKDCRAALEKLRRNQMRMGSLQQLQMNQRQAADELAEGEGDLRQWAARLELDLPPGDFSPAHAQVLLDAMIDFRASVKELESLGAEEKKRRQELEDHAGRIREREAEERRILVGLGLSGDDLEAGFSGFQEQVRRFGEYRELQLQREKLSAALEGQCRGKRIEQIESDLAGVRRQREQVVQRWPQLGQLPSEANPARRADEHERQRMKNRQRELRDAIRAAEVWVETQRAGLECLAEKREEEKALESRIRRLEEFRDRLLLAHQVLSEIALQSHRRWSEELTESVGPMLSRLTLGRYEKVIIDPELSIHLAAPAPSAGATGNGEHAPEKMLSPDEVERSLSTGTLDQLYFCLRVAVAGLISPRERLPLLLDDPFLTFDEERRRAALEWLAELADHHQALYFTCNPTYAEALARAGGAPEVLELA